MEEWCETPKGERHGPYLNHHSDRKTNAVEGTYWKGKKDGVWTSFFSTGVRRELSTFAAGLKHGRSILWYANREKRLDGSYHHGKLDGEWDFRWFNPDVNTTTMTFCEGAPCKTWTTRKPDGKVVDRVETEQPPKTWSSASL